MLELFYSSSFDRPLVLPEDLLLFHTHHVAVLLRFGLDPNICSKRGISLGGTLAQKVTANAFLFLIIAGLDLDTNIDNFGVRSPLTCRAVAQRLWPTVRWNEPFTVIRQQCAMICRQSQVERRYKRSALEDLLLHKIP